MISAEGRFCLQVRSRVVCSPMPSSAFPTPRSTPRRGGRGGTRVSQSLGLPRGCGRCGLRGGGNEPGRPVASFRILAQPRSSGGKEIQALFGDQAYQTSRLEGCLLPLWPPGNYRKATRIKCSGHFRPASLRGPSSLLRTPGCDPCSRPPHAQ